MKASKPILLSVFFSLVVLATLGCKKRPEVSWTDYNTVEDVYYHFTHNREEAEAHLGDTLKVFGYIHICYENCYGMHEMTVSKELAHTYDGTLLYFNPFVILNLPKEYPSLYVYADTLAYVTGTVSYDGFEIGGMFLDVTEIKSNPGENEED